MEQLVRFTILPRPHAGQLVGRYSERKDKGLVTPADSHINAALSRTA
jgi:arsenic resistance protein ArsH